MFMYNGWNMFYNPAIATPLFTSLILFLLDFFCNKLYEYKFIYKTNSTLDQQVLNMLEKNQGNDCHLANFSTQSIMIDYYIKKWTKFQLNTKEFLDLVSVTLNTNDRICLIFENDILEMSKNSESCLIMRISTNNFKCQQTNLKIEIYKKNKGLSTLDKNIQLDIGNWMSKEELSTIECIDKFMQAENFYSRKGLAHCTSVFCYGKPGTGKSHFAMILAARYSMNLKILSISELLDSTEQFTNKVVLLDDFDLLLQPRNQKSDQNVIMMSKTPVPNNKEKLKLLLNFLMGLG